MILTALTCAANIEQVVTPWCLAVYIIGDTCAMLIWPSLQKNCARRNQMLTHHMCTAVLCLSTALGGMAPHAHTFTWFVNLETQFEEAVRTCIRSVLRESFRTERAIRRPPLFRATSGRYAANPDMVIRNAGATVAIADAKYKDIASWPAASDMHELLCHASAYRAGKAFLIFPNEAAFTSRYLGLSATECDVWVFGITFDHFEDDLRTALGIVGLTSTPEIVRKLQ